MNQNTVRNPQDLNFLEKSGVKRDGYPSLATWIAHDPDNESYVFRKFNRLSARNLLNLQCELFEIESKLATLDDRARQSEDFQIRQSMRRWETFIQRAVDPNNIEHEQIRLNGELRAKLKEYHEALLLQSAICALKPPSSRVLKTYRAFFNNPRPIVSGNAKYMLDDAGDLAALRPPLDTDPLSQLLRDHWPFQGRPYPDPRDNTRHFLDVHVSRTVAAITTLVAAALLIGPISGLYFEKKPGTKLGMIAGFTTLFAVSVGGLTSAKRQEVFAASAAYAAVLVVFVSGNLSNG